MNPEQIHRAAALWLERRQCPDWTAADQTALNAWLSNTTHKVAYLRIEALWQRTERLTALRRPQRESMRADKPPARNTVWPNYRKAAASLALACLIGTFAWQHVRMPAEQTFATAIGGHQTIILSDGTHVELNTDTVLRVSNNGNERKVWLDKGEAFFEVEHDAARPFTVIAQGRKITDLGTKFAVRQDKDNKLRIAVVEGLVEVEAKGPNPQSLLKPGHILTATSQSQSVSQKPLRAILTALNWKSGKLFLENTTLAEAVAEFNRYNTRKLVINDIKTASLTITGIFETRNPDSFTNATKYLFGLQVEQKNDQIILSSTTFSEIKK